MTIQLTDTSVRSGEKVKKTGRYALGTHVTPNESDCLILESEKLMTLTEGSTAPKLLSCQHKAKWVLITSD